MPTTPHGVNYESNRPVVMGRNGMVCSAHPLASQAGMSVLQMGGNAVDAAIATAAALNVVEPNMSGIGGDGYIMVYNREAGTIEVCNATGAAPYAAALERYQATGIPVKGVLSASVPGLLDGWMSAHSKYGSLSLAQVFDPALDLADNGFPVTHVLSGVIAGDSLIQQFPTSQKIFAPKGSGLKPGEIIYQKDLARTFQTIVDGGRDAYYEGPAAEAMVKFSEEQGGLLSMKDFADCRSRWEAPISTTYRGYSVYEAPPNSSGHVLLQELNLVEQFDLRGMGCNTAESIHLMVEAKKLSFADREAYMADPDFVEVPTAGLVSKSYAKERAALISPGAGRRRGAAGRPLGPPTRRPAAARRGRRFGPGGRHHLLRGGGPLGQRRMPASEHPELAGLQRRRRRHRGVAQQPYDLLASGPAPRGLLAARQAGTPHHEPGDGLPGWRGLQQRRRAGGESLPGLRDPRRRHPGADEYAGYLPRSRLWHDRGRGRGSAPLA